MDQGHKQHSKNYKKELQEWLHEKNYPLNENVRKTLENYELIAGMWRDFDRSLTLSYHWTTWQSQWPCLSQNNFATSSIQHSPVSKSTQWSDASAGCLRSMVDVKPSTLVLLDIRHIISFKTCFLQKQVTLESWTRYVHKSLQLKDLKRLKHVARHSAKDSHFGLKFSDIHIRLLLDMKWSFMWNSTLHSSKSTWTYCKAFNWILMKNACRF